MNWQWVALENRCCDRCGVVCGNASGEALDTVIFLSGKTRGATLEGIGRSLGRAFAAFDIHFIEISLLDMTAFLEAIKAIDFRRVVLVFSFVSMGLEIPLRRADGSSFDLWTELGIPFFSIHGDSPAYFFDRHVVRDNRTTSVYLFPEHCALRARLPLVNGMLQTAWLIPLDAVEKERIDFRRKRSGKLLFLKNGKDLQHLRRFWRSCLQPPLLDAIEMLASELASDLDNPAGNQIDDLVVRCFADMGLDISALTRTRLFFVAQLDDFLRAVKCTRMAEALMGFPVEIRGNNWGHLDFTGKRATCIDDCDFTRSTELIRGALGIIDMSPNTAAQPHDRVMRAYGAHTACLTNQQLFLAELPGQHTLTFTYENGNLEDRIADVLAHPQETIEMGIEVAAAYNHRHPADETVRQLLACAAAVRFERQHDRPAGSQDFFAWPQRLG